MSVTLGEVKEKVNELVEMLEEVTDRVKDWTDLEEGDFVKCVYEGNGSWGVFTKGETYEVITSDVDVDGTVSVKDDEGKSYWVSKKPEEYYGTSAKFEVASEEDLEKEDAEEIAYKTAYKRVETGAGYTVGKLYKVRKDSDGDMTVIDDDKDVRPFFESDYEIVKATERVKTWEELEEGDVVKDLAPDVEREVVGKHIAEGAIVVKLTSGMLWILTDSEYDILSTVEEEIEKEEKSTPTFKVGDIVTGTSDNSYNITSKKAIMKVSKIVSNENIFVEVLSHKTRKGSVGIDYPVEAKYFQLATELL